MHQYLENRSNVKSLLGGVENMKYSWVLKHSQINLSNLTPMLKFTQAMWILWTFWSEEHFLNVVLICNVPFKLATKLHFVLVHHSALCCCHPQFSEARLQYRKPLTHRHKPQAFRPILIGWTRVGLKPQTPELPDRLKVCHNGKSLTTSPYIALWLDGTLELSLCGFLLKQTCCWPYFGDVV